MEIPLKILNRLRSGNDVAAQVTPSEPGNWAWVYVAPVTDRLSVTPWYFHKERDRDEKVDPSIRYFLVRHLEVTDKIAQWFLKWGFNDPDGDLGNPPFDDLYFPANEAELTALVGRWVSDPAAFHFPDDVEYYFEEAGALISDIINRRDLEYGPGLIEQIRQGGFHGPKVIESEDRPLH